MVLNLIKLIFLTSNYVGKYSYILNLFTLCVYLKKYNLKRYET